MKGKVYDKQRDLTFIYLDDELRAESSSRKHASFNKRKTPGALRVRLFINFNKKNAVFRRI